VVAALALAIAGAMVTNRGSNEAQSSGIIFTKSGPIGAAAGSTFTYTLSFTNTTGAPLDAVTIADTLPGGVTFISCSTTGATACANGGLTLPSLGPVSGAANGVGGSGTVTTLPQPLAGGATLTVTVTVQAPGTAATLQNTATYTANGAQGSRTGVSNTVTTVVTSAPGAPSPGASSVSFPLFPNVKFLPCLAAPGATPSVTATVQRGSLNDLMTLQLAGFRPGLAFDLFTVQRSPQLADGSPDPAFAGSFGLAWYQSDIEVGPRGTASVTIQTILLDQIFGFDPDAGLSPTNTFHVGFWFNSPADAAPCGFIGTTPFNGDHNAGPLAFITRPNAVTGLGPLCTNPTTSTFGVSCNP
jgi:uncharacterized repeat protein (TIGR01451 family)